MSDLTNRQLRALALNKLDGPMSGTEWRKYGFSHQFVENLVNQGYLRVKGLETTITAKGKRALQESR